MSGGNARSAPRANAEPACSCWRRPALTRRRKLLLHRGSLPLHARRAGLAAGTNRRTERGIAGNTIVAPYSEADFTADMERFTSEHCDPDLTSQLVSRDNDAARWLADKGIRWRLMRERQASRSNGQWVFFGGLAAGVVLGEKGLMTQHDGPARWPSTRQRRAARASRRPTTRR